MARGSTAPRPVGRPRSSGEAPDGSARDAIVMAATRLFATQGYANTTMTAIAAAAGLRQPSVYYWFRRKEDVLKATLAIGRSSNELLESLGDDPGSAASKLYRFLRADTLELCLSPCDFTEVERAAEHQPEELADFWAGYDELNRRVATLVAEGIAAGQLRPVDPELAATTLVTLTEGAQRRFRNHGAHEPGGDNPFQYAARSAAEYADHVAESGLRGLLADPSTFDAIRSEAGGDRPRP